MSILRSALILSCTLFALPSIAYQPLDKLPQGSRASLYVETLSNSSPLISTNNGQQLIPPASTLKLVTALAAQLELGDSFRFETHLAKHANDLVIQFNGDPTLTTEDIKQLFINAKGHGLNKISGDIWLDSSAFSGYDRAVGWPWDILGVCYSAPASAISLDENCVQASLYTQNNGHTRVYVPEHFPIYVSTEAITVTKEQQQATQCDLELIASSDNHYQLQGCLVERSKPLPLKFALQSPERYAQRMVSNIINQLNIEFNGEIKVAKPLAVPHEVLASHYSAPLPELLEEMLKKSDNLIADNLTKTLGAKFYVQPGSFANGTKAIKQIIYANSGIDLNAFPLVDGSGLSRNNRMSSDAMAKILRYIWQHDATLGLIDKMPTSGVDGTLKYRSSMRKEPIKGAITAKSGSVYGSYNMAGFGLDKKGEPVTMFVQYIADYHPKKRSPDAPKVMAPITHFETLFYKDIVNFSQAVK